KNAIETAFEINEQAAVKGLKNTG
ncbi:MAG: hypothetical protein JWR69_4668, partial [Pedosphaera sp.]|nr:hypothetical protein [Pedosphaera sp.]